MSKVMTMMTNGMTMMITSVLPDTIMIRHLDIVSKTVEPFAVMELTTIHMKMSVRAIAPIIVTAQLGITTITSFILAFALAIHDVQ